MLKRLILILTASSLVGCTLPGMKLDTDAQSDQYGIQLHEIDGQLLREQSAYANHLVDGTDDEQLESVSQLPRDYLYTVGPRDILSIIVWQHPELTNPTGNFQSAEANGRVVRADGTIFFPFVGVVNVDGRTVEEVRSLLSSKLSPYIKSPQIDVSVVSYRARKAYVTGEVKTPNIQYLTNEPATLMDAVSRSGGLTELADRRRATLTRDGRRYEIDLLELYAHGGIGQNVVLQDNDTLHIHDNRFNQVFVVGEVTHQSSVEMHKGHLTLAEVLSSSEIEGLNFDTAKVSEIYVIRGLETQVPNGAQVQNGEIVGNVAIQGYDEETDVAVITAAETRMPLVSQQSATSEILVPHVFHLDASSPEALLLADRFELMPRDVVFVSTMGLSRWNRVVKQILPTLQSLFQIRALERAL